MDIYFQENAEEFKDKILFAKVDINVSPTIANRYGVLGTPTLKFFCNGLPVFELVGVVAPTLLKKTVVETIENGPTCVEKTSWRPPEITGYS
jgi:thioredoxin-like negative regulator of GroEL